MSLPFLILAGTVAYTVIFPDHVVEGGLLSGGSNNEGGGGGGPSSVKTGSAASSSSSKRSAPVVVSSSSSIIPSSKSVSIFLSGLFVGVGLSVLASYELKRTRLWQRVRLKLLSWLYDDLSSYTISAAWTDGGLGDESDNTTTNDTNDTNTDDDDDTRLVDKFRKPTRLETITGGAPIVPGPRHHQGGDGWREQQRHGCGSHVVDLVSTDWTLTNGMSVDMLTLAPGSELLPDRSKGVEFYYVVKGDGELLITRGRSDDDGSSSSSSSIVSRKERIAQGMGFIVDPDTTRGFQALKRKNLVLLRATDVSDTSGGSGSGSSGARGENVSIQSNNNSNSNSKLSNAKNMVVAGLGKIQSMVEAYGSDADPVVSSNTVPTVDDYNNTFDQ